MARNESVHYEESGNRYEVKIGRDQLIEYRDTCKKAKKAKKDMDEANAKRDKMQPEILEIMEEIGQNNVKVGGSLVYLHRQLWANAKVNERGERDYETSCEALRDAGLGELVAERFNVQSVSSVIRELDKNDDVPEELYDGLHITEKISARVKG